MARSPHHPTTQSPPLLPLPSLLPHHSSPQAVIRHARRNIRRNTAAVEAGGGSLVALPLAWGEPPPVAVTQKRYNATRAFTLTQLRNPKPNPQPQLPTPTVGIGSWWQLIAFTSNSFIDRCYRPCSKWCVLQTSSGPRVTAGPTAGMAEMAEMAWGRVAPRCSSRSSEDIHRRRPGA